MATKRETAEAEKVILSFVRGECSWRALEKAGIYIELKDDGYEIDNPWRIVAKACPLDLAQGILAYRRAPNQLQRWAGIILAGSSFLDLGEDFETTPEGGVLLNALWDSAFGGQVNPNALSVAESLVRQG